jgi:putative ABC transport system permease protein
MLIGVTLMVDSFRQTLRVWIGASIQADVYIAPQTWSGKGRTGGLTPDVIADLTRHPAIEAVDRLRRFSGYSGDQRIGISGVEMDLDQGKTRFPLLSGAAPDAHRLAQAHGAVFIGETLARKLDRWGGDALPIHTPDGVKEFPIAAVFYDYSTDGGAVVMDLTTMEQAFGPGPIHSLALYLKAGYAPETIVDALKAARPNAPLEIRSNRHLRAEIMHIFDQTFAVTYLLQLMSLLIAVSGIALMLLVLAREQVAELALYQSLGAKRRQIFSVFVGSGLSMGAMGLALGGGGGLLLASVLIYVT